jgi:nucleoside-diphosphate-sugar epimerase
MNAIRYLCGFRPRWDRRRTIGPVMSAFVIELPRGARPVIYASGKNWRGFIFVNDVNDFHLFCATDALTDADTSSVECRVHCSVREVFARLAAWVGHAGEPAYGEDMPRETGETRADIPSARSLGRIPQVDVSTGRQRSIAFARERAVRSVTSSAGAS